MIESSSLRFLNLQSSFYTKYCFRYLLPFSVYTTVSESLLGFFDLKKLFQTYSSSAGIVQLQLEQDSGKSLHDQVSIL